MDEIRDGWQESALDARQKAALAWTDAFLAPAPRADAALRETALAHFTPAELVELSAGLALFLGFSKIALALGGVPERVPVHVQPTPDWPPDPSPEPGG